ncbi:choline O-acetyltransferase-like [Babylonia areolata]|uniref:choline O-acetyltransferase-like n=1 Tax=Babylonia areolata TaxID=304850 RepID=UPI003FD66A18
MQAINAEHSVAEAGAVAAFLVHMQDYCLSSHPTCERNEGQDPRCLAEPVWLKWTTTSGIDADIARAKEDVDRNVENVDICYYRFEEFGTKFPKSQGFSPNVFVQLALQLTYYRMHGRMPMSYESASLRRFRSGRVDNIRANSPAALAWIQAMCGEVEATEAEKLALLQTAAEWQQRYQTEAINGFGIDCHLIGLREAARELNVLDSIPLFSDPSFQKAFYFPLSTSQVPTERPIIGIYSAVVPEGYGVPYNLFADHMIIIVTSFRDCAETSSQKFMNCLRSCFLDMRDMCLSEK